MALGRRTAHRLGVTLLPSQEGNGIPMNGGQKTRLPMNEKKSTIESIPKAGISQPSFLIKELRLGLRLAKRTPTQ